MFCTRRRLRRGGCGVGCPRLRPPQQLWWDSGRGRVRMRLRMLMQLMVLLKVLQVVLRLQQLCSLRSGVRLCA
jgi:hypothetical protein